ncbi:ankyrin repeat and IBR domain-containing protein 1-like protein [Leptotrombidium deliense]|uniref:RBR-type E3 ubiquitin transferase n=1 Tax=Leptotrombidium deliense TaxID=299467 RepID=A0A443SHJ8_9ACAR|nr:ankyrin repeat and IBR domain-containing protein 1-like protein [Leptotrombidium deliense]
MGTTSTKLRRYLQSGDEYNVLKTLHTHPDFLRNFDCNQPLSSDAYQNSAVHLAAKFGIKPLIRIFLFDLNGNPNVTNAFRQTALHLINQIPRQQKQHQSNTSDGNRRSGVSVAIQERRAMCTAIILQWKRQCSSIEDIDRNDNESVNISAIDANGNTALHYAAASGLFKSVQLLVDWGIALFIKNKEGDTACDLAENNRFFDIAAYLEVAMVFGNEKQRQSASTSTINNAIEYLMNGGNNGLRQQDLQEAKDQLLVETSDMFHITLFAAEALLRNYEWSREVLLEDWIRSPKSCFEKAGIPPPSDEECCELTSHQVHLARSESLINTNFTCGICLMEISEFDSNLLIPCNHLFCANCWREYLTMKIEEGDVYAIFCPAYECIHLVPVELLESVVSPEVIRRYLQIDLNVFVETNPKIKWCPAPGCGKAVRISESDLPLLKEPVVIGSAPPLPAISHAVDCGSGHYFCWECLNNAHAPCGCTLWEEWLFKVCDIKPEELRKSYAITEEAANNLWLIKHSKQCPKCKAHIQKLDGCNHMKCSKCKHDFCWVCLEPWRKHSSATGGYFKCNRSEVVQKVRENVIQMKKDALARNSEVYDIKRFVRHYTRYKMNEDTGKSEQEMLPAVKNKEYILLRKWQKLKKSDGCEETEEDTTKQAFLTNAVLELCKTRRVLCGAYVYSYYLDNHTYSETLNDYIEDLESAAEVVSKIVRGAYVKCSRNKVIELTCKVKRKRIEFLKTISQGLNICETSPKPKRRRRVRRRRPYFPKLKIDPFTNDYYFEDSEVERELLESLNDDPVIKLDSKNPWVKDSSGKHANLAIYDWPEEDDEDDDLEDCDDEDNDSDFESLGICKRKGCFRRRVKNPRSNEVHDYCSLKCKQLAEIEKEEINRPKIEHDDSMDLTLAVEMSKLQAIEAKQSRQSMSLQDDDSSLLSLDESGTSIFDAIIGDISRPASNVKEIASSSTSRGKQSVAHRAISFFLKSPYNNPSTSKNLNDNYVDNKIEKELFADNDVDDRIYF